ncbi:MAG: hypothetical protein DRH17_02495 [Deltaproteobacteria bacterium]|nr:MAG: hypothetical protein DRH17_02495 [Deltaproteobacteria bacterium]
MAYVDFITKLHKSTKRDYSQRVIEHVKAEYVQVAIQYGRGYWDGDRKYGYCGTSTLDTADCLSGQGIETAVLLVPTIKPLDTDVIVILWYAKCPSLIVGM